MPRADTKQVPQQFYQSQFNGSYVDPQPSAQPSQPTANPPPKKKHVCPTCERAFTTSGHLARHSRVHTGERNHKCPFPGCETRCSRQDNLQQHYRIHLSPGSRRSSTRSAMARAINGAKRTGAAATAGSPTMDASANIPPLSAPPALEPARVYAHHSTPPDSPPPLAQATLPATAHPLPHSRASSSPETSYSHHSMSMAQPLSMPQAYSYRSGTTTYQEQSQGAGFTYVHTTPISHSSASPSFPYPSSYENSSLSQIHSASSPILHSPDPSASPISLSSRHSISHISHPQSFPTQPPSAGPPSPASSHSVSSHTSGPPTPTYPFHDDPHSYHGTGVMSDQPGLSNGHMSPQGHMVHPGYSPTIPVQNGGLSANRYDSPPPILAPIQDDRVLRRGEDHRHLQSHHGSPHIYHPQPLPTDYPYSHHSLGLGPGAWKSEHSLRVKGVGALIQ